VHISCPANCDDDAAARRQFQHRLDGFLSLTSIRRILETSKVSYGKDINVTRYETFVDANGATTQRRVTLDKLPPPSSSGETGFVVAQPADVWRQWDAGCTIRLLCPHLHSPPIHALLSLLEYEWGCMVGANAYLTPTNAAQGFAPHYDDIDAYCLQLQGKKRWKVYAPLRLQERLPRTSSRDYTAADLHDVTPVLDVVLEPGDVLYMPRGWIHQACTLPLDHKRNADDDSTDQQHSLHLTVSAMQHWAWADLMEILLPEALEATISAETTILRQGLPPRFLDYMGAMHDNREENVPEMLQQKPSSTNDNAEVTESDLQPLQEEFRAQAKRRIMRFAKEAVDMLDAACDQLGKRFLSDRLPPVFTINEANDTNRNDSATRHSVKNPSNKRNATLRHIQPNTLCRLVRPGIARLVLEQSMAAVYHCLENSVVYHEHPLSPLEFEMDDAPALEQLLTTVPPHWIAVEDLIHDSLDDKVGVAQALYDEGILAVRSD
jgi:bifunctional lysine-specific demethylase and histidyl-hydroxylase NO66